MYDVQVWYGCTYDKTGEGVRVWYHVGIHGSICTEGHHEVQNGVENMFKLVYSQKGIEHQKCNSVEI